MQTVTVQKIPQTFSALKASKKSILYEMYLGVFEPIVVVSSSDDACVGLTAVGINALSQPLVVFMLYCVILH